MPWIHWLGYLAKKRPQTARRGECAVPEPAPAEVVGRGADAAREEGLRPRQAGDLSSPESGPVTRHIFAGSESGEPRSPGKGRAAPAQTASVRPLRPRRRWGRPNSRTRPGFRVRASRAKERTKMLPLLTRAGAAPNLSPHTSARRGSDWPSSPAALRGANPGSRSDRPAASPHPSLPQASRSGSSARPLQSWLWLSLPGRGSLGPQPPSRPPWSPGPGQHLLGR